MNFKKFDVSDNQWHDVPYYQHKTATDTLTLPAVIYPNDTSITVGIKGNTTQSGTPSPSNPVSVDGVGELETSGEHAGQYKIPISSANTTMPVYLGEVQTTRQIKKLVLTGEETFGYANSCFTYTFNGKPTSVQPIKEVIFSNIYEGVEPKYRDQLRNYQCCITRNYNQIAIRDNNYADATDFKSYLSSQYAAGTPVTVWYVLATETTGIRNEPLRKIGDYADTVSGITIPTIAGANNFDVLTTLKPSEVTVNYKGWHPAQSVHERESGAWT